MISDEILYTRTHEWIKKDGENSVKIGLTDHAQEELGDIVGVELPELDAEFAKEDPIGVIESVKAVSDVNCPINGKIIEINEILEETPELINEDPFGKGWVAKIELEDESELDELMNQEEYQSFIDAEE
ncbi:glycine cleavage system protein GcvH [bacterium]|nr:glycine cleavage system protein GcvH [bacterium]